MGKPNYPEQNYPEQKPPEQSETEKRAIAENEKLIKELEEKKAELEKIKPEKDTALPSDTWPKTQYFLYKAKYPRVVNIRPSASGFMKLGDGTMKSIRTQTPINIDFKNGYFTLNRAWSAGVGLTFVEAKALIEQPYNGFGQEYRLEAEGEGDIPDIEEKPKETTVLKGPRAPR